MASEFVYPLRIHIEDTDCTRLVFHPNYLKFMERARSEWLRNEGLGIEWQKENQILFVIHSIAIQYLKPAFVHKMVEVVSRCKKVGAASLILDQYLREPNDDSNILCRAEIKVACVDTAYRPCPLPDSNRIRRILT